MSPRTIYLLAVTVSIACAPAATTSGTPASATPGIRRDLNVITEDEITASMGSSVYDVVSKLRPNFLKTRGRTSMNASGSGYASVFLDGQPYGDLNTLRNINASQAHEIRYYSATEAATKFGMQNGAGVIDVRTK